MVSLGKPMLKERAEVAALLWENQVKTEFTSEFDTDSLEKINEQCRLMGIPNILILKERLYHRECAVRVRSVFTRHEVTIRTKDLVTYIHKQRLHIHHSAKSRV